MNDRTIQPAPIVADQEAGVKHARILPNAHFRTLWPRPFFGQPVRAIEHDFPAW